MQPEEANLRPRVMGQVKKKKLPRRGVALRGSTAACKGVGVQLSAVMIAALQLMWREGGSSFTQLSLSQEFIFRTRESPLNLLD